MPVEEGCLTCLWKKETSTKENSCTVFFENFFVFKFFLVVSKMFILNFNRTKENLEREKFFASGSMSDVTPYDLLQPRSDFAMRNRYLSRIGAKVFCNWSISSSRFWSLHLSLCSQNWHSFKLQCTDSRAFSASSLNGIPRPSLKVEEIWRRKSCYRYSIPFLLPATQSPLLPLL